MQILFCCSSVESVAAPQPESTFAMSGAVRTVEIDGGGDHYHIARWRCSFRVVRFWQRTSTKFADVSGTVAREWIWSVVHSSSLFGLIMLQLKLVLIDSFYSFLGRPYLLSHSSSPCSRCMWVTWKENRLTGNLRMSIRFNTMCISCIWIC